tara:strand:+ start:1730 stop:4096 length:2367 start_codon:yes stop_codon:yes gene_type:complete
MTVKQDIKMFLDNLSVKDKVEVLKELYKDIAGLGVEGDTELAHINTFEANLLVKCGGSGTLHPVTGLPQYKGGGGGTPQATYQNTTQASRIPEEVAPFAEDVLTEAQDYYRMIMNQGYDPYTGAVIAPQTTEQTEAQAGLAALGRGAQGTALQQEALDLQRQQGERFTPEVAQEYMSPYQRAVTDIEKRQAVEDFQRNVMPQFEAQAVQAGGMSGLGSRAGVQAGILGENLQQRLGDIEAKGLQSAFLNAQQQFQNQKQREAAQAQQTAALGPAMFSQGLAQQGALQTVGEQRQNLAQKALDEQYFKFLEQKAFPEEQLAKYSGFVYGNPLLAQRDVTGTATSGRNVNQPSSGAQLLGTGLAAANTFRQMAPQTFGSFTSGVGSLFGAKTGGGLSGIVYRDNGGQAKRMSKVGETSALVQAATERARRLRNEDPNYIIPEVEINREELIPVGQEFAGGVYAKEIEDRYGPTAIEREERQARQAPTMGVGGVSAEGYSSEGGDRLSDAGILSRMDTRFDPVVQRRLAEERERSRESFYGKSDRERRAFNRSMADRRRAERDEDYQRRRKLVGEADPVGTLLSQLSQSLLRTRDFDEQTGIGARLAEGLGRTSSKLSEADKERRAKLLKIEDEFGRRRAEESEKEFEAEGQLLSRGEEREALALAREFKLEDKILDLPYAKQRKALELINAGLKGEKLRAEIEKLKAEAAAEGSGGFDPSELVALNKVYDNALDQITGPGIIEGKIIDPKFKEADRKARQAIANRTTNGPEAQSLYVDFISDYQRNNFKG